MNIILRLIRSRAARNAGWIVVCKGVQAVFGLILSMLTTRYLGPERYGLINYAASILLFASPVAQLGYTATLVSEIVKKPDQEGEILGSAIASSIVSSVLCLAGVSAFVRIANPQEPTTILVCELYNLLLISQGIELIQYWFQSKLLARYTALTTLVIYLLVFVYQVFILLTNGSIYLLSISKALQHGVIAMALLVFYHRMGGQKLRFSFSCTRRLLEGGRPFILSCLMMVIFAQTDRIMIKNMIGDEAMGYYSAAIMCATCSEFLFVAIIDSFRPGILEARLHSEAGFEDRMRGLYAVMIVLSLVQSVIITLLARPILLLLCGSAYLPAQRTLQIVVWYTAFSYIGSARSIWIIAEEKQRLLLPINVSGAMVNIGLNLMLIPRRGIEGAAIATLLTQIFTNVVMGFVLKPIRPNNRLLMDALKPSSLSGFLKNL